MTHVDPKTEGATPAAGSYAAKTRAWIQANLTDELRTDRCLDPGATLQQKIDFEAAQHIGGLTGIMWPKDYGGHGLTVREHLEANREIGLSPMPNAVNSIGKELAGPIIMAVGREDQKRDLLPTAGRSTVRRSGPRARRNRSAACCWHARANPRTATRA